MSSVVIRPEDGQPDSLKALLAAVRRHAGDERVTVGSGGVVVSRAVAKKFLNARTADVETAGVTVDNTRAPLITRHHDGTGGDTAAAEELTIGGRTPDGGLPGGHAGVPADQRQTTAPDSRADAAGQAADGGPSPAGVSGGASAGEPTPTPPRQPAKKSTPAKKTTAAAQQRASRSTRSNP